MIEITMGFEIGVKPTVSLEDWGYLFLAGKKLRVTISFNYNYVETGQLSAILRSINQRSSTI
jgi:hypothetical protein